MEKQFKMIVNGQSLQQQDVNQISAEAALADDHILSELFKMKRYTGSAVQKAIVPYGSYNWSAEYSLTSTALIQGNTADGKVRVLPFKAFVSSTDNTNTLSERQEIRSGYGIANVTGYTTLTVAPNATANPRWDLVKVAVVPNSSAAAATRYVKDPVSLVVAPVAIAINTSVVVTISIDQGVAAASPVRPALPVDSAGTYYIALGYVYVPAGHTALSIVSRNSIHEVAPTLPLHSTTGAVNIKPATSLYSIPGPVDTNQSGNTETLRPGAYLPSTMVGGESRIILLQLGLAPKSHLDGEVVDDSVDWRFRFFKASCYAGQDTTTDFAFASDKRATSNQIVPGFLGDTGSLKSAVKFGQSFWNDTANGSFGDPTAAGYALYLQQGDMPIAPAAGQAVSLVVDSQGRLIVRYSAGTAAQVFIWLEATGPFSNFGTV